MASENGSKKMLGKLLRAPQNSVSQMAQAAVLGNILKRPLEITAHRWSREPLYAYRNVDQNQADDR